MDNKKKEVRNKEILELYRLGVSVSKIVEIYGITKQRVNYIIKNNIQKWERLKIREKRRSGKTWKKNEERRKEAELAYNISYDQYLVWKNLVKKGKRWSIFHTKCRYCDRDDIPHHVNGYCNDCSWRHYKDIVKYANMKKKLASEWRDKVKKDRKEYMKNYYEENREKLLAYNNNRAKKTKS